MTVTNQYNLLRTRAQADAMLAGTSDLGERSGVERRRGMPPGPAVATPCRTRERDDETRRGGDRRNEGGIAGAQLAVSVPPLDQEMQRKRKRERRRYKPDPLTESERRNPPVRIKDHHGPVHEVERIGDATDRDHRRVV